jgi:hypothetical protein
MRKVLRDNGLSLALLVMFLGCLAAQGCFGHRAYNQEQLAHGRHGVELGEYLRGGHFWSATGENWESEFLQMFVYVILTAYLYQKGSSESRQPDAENPQDRDPRLHRRRPDAPWVVRHGGAWLLKLYEHSLSLAFVLLFGVSITVHALGGLSEFNEEQLEHGGAAVSMSEFLRDPEFWFQSFQNWQSEFLAILSMVVLSIWLRERRSPESKPVDAPHSETGAG